MGRPVKVGEILAQQKYATKYPAWQQVAAREEMEKKDKDELLTAVATEAPKPLGLIQKLALIRREIPNIEKKGENKHFGYKFMQASDVAGDIGDRLAEMNIVLGIEDVQVAVHPHDKGVMTVVTCTYVLKDGDSGETHRVSSAGSDNDLQGKSVYKCLTGCLKYALTQALSMRVGHMDAEDDGGSPETPSRMPARPASRDHKDRLTVIKDYLVKYPDEETPMFKKCGVKSVDEISEGQAIRICEIIVKKLGIKPEQPGDSDIGF